MVVLLDAGQPLVVPRWMALPVWVVMAVLVNSFSAVVVDAQKFQYEDLHLKEKSRSYSNIPVEALSSGAEDDGLIRDIDGNQYSLSSLEPYVELFSSKHYVPSSENTKIVDTRTSESMEVTIFRAAYDDGSVLLVEKDELGSITYIELRRAVGEPDMFLVPTEELQGVDSTTAGESEFLLYTDEDIDYELLQSQFNYEDVVIPDHDDKHRKKRLLRSTETASQNELVPNFDYREGRGLRVGCSSYLVVNLAAVFDAEFCERNGSFEASRRRIMTIVASASFHYERDMCVRLELTDIYTPESSCSTTNRASFFAGFDRDFPCGGGTNASFLSLFGKWMNRNRARLNFDTDATVHMFTGHSPPSGTIGCAYVGSFCNSEYTYGVEYMAFSSNPHSQGVVLAHEIGHILNAPHLATSPYYRHVMEPNINNAADGFSQFSKTTILSFLHSSSITCSGSTNNVPTPLPTSRPTKKTTSPPTKNPTLPPVDNRCTISQNPSHEPVCIFSSSEGGQYACYDSDSLLNARASSSCLFSPPRTRIERCNGPLRSGQNLNDGGSELSSPNVFETRTCRASCVVVSNFLCFRADRQEQVYTISYTVLADFDVSTTFTEDIFVKRNNGSNSCDVATTICRTA